MATASIQSEGDLEVVILHESHSLLAHIVSSQLYSINGVPPEQTAQFHDRPHFDLFLILTIELYAEGARSAYINNSFQNWSLLKGISWLAKKYPQEAQESGLDTASGNLLTWLDREVPLEFWCSDVDLDVKLSLRNDRLISFGANTAKHHLLRISELIAKLNTLCVNAGYNFTPQQLVAVLDCMMEEVRSRLMYHSTYILELLGQLFFSLNRIVWARYNKKPTNRVMDMDFPSEITSDVFRNLYGSVLVFKRYDDARITSNTPSTTHLLRGRYQ